MVQWVNRLRNNIFVNAPPLPLLCEISGALHLVQPGLTVGWLAGWPASGLAGRAGWLAGGLAGWLAGWPAGRLAGWLGWPGRPSV